MKETAIIYSRVSTLDQDTEAQLKSIDKYCKSHNFEIIHEPWTEKVSGTIKGSDRKEMGELLDWIKKNKVSNLVVYELTRLGRTIKNVHDIYNQLNDAGICLHCVKDGIISLEKGKPSLVGNVLVSLLAVFSEFEHKSIIERTTNGKYNAIVEHNHWTAGHILPYGYKKIDKKLAIDKDEEQVIKKIFDLCEEGKSTLDIARQLNNEGIKTRYNKLYSNREIKIYRFKKNTDDIIWSNAQIHKILKHTIYKGDRIYRDMTLSVPAIITREQFDKCQQILFDNQIKKGPKTKIFYLLENIGITCGICDHNFYSQVNKKTNAYYCSSKIRGKCDSHGIGIKKLTNSIWMFVRHSEELMKWMTKNINSSEIALKIQSLTLKLESLKVELKSNEDTERHLVQLLIKGVSKTIYDEELSKVIKERNKLDKSIKEVTEQIEINKEYQNRQNNISNEITNIKGDKFLMKEYLEKIIDKVRIYPVRDEFYLGGKRTGHTILIELYFKSTDKPLTYLVAQHSKVLAEIEMNEYDYTTNKLLGSKKEIMKRTKKIFELE